MKCPSCAAPAEEGAVECPKCGILFAKFAAVEERRKREAAAALAALEAPPVPAYNPWLGRGIAVGLVALWVLAFGLYFRFHRAHFKKPLGEKTGEYAEMRDPVTGNLKVLPIRRGPGVKRAPGAELPPPVEPEPAPSAPPAGPLGKMPVMPNP